MARKKSRRAALLKKPMAPKKLDTIFTCPFCNNPNTVVCTFDKKTMVGEAACCVCKANYITDINFLTEPIDIYSEWIDECERVNTPTKKVVLV
ncbi:transcription elongation factor 1 homolog [Mercurialis annua]|uniref:transcription elongation factor 1 homolog n=1 Tax=Mercurialis annua TaxID=3986 RepID=UPI00215E0C2D|nr:transcription elongation factor 1 homolog [Mercurialis annua]